MLSEFIQQHKGIAIILSLLLVGLIGYGAYVAISRAGKEPITVHLVPGEAILTANGERIGSGTAYLAPGEYEIEAKRDGFADYKAPLTIHSPNTAVIDIALTPVSEEAKKWAKEHQELYFAYEGRTGERANAKGEEFSERNPIVSRLPFENFLYAIGYRADPDDSSGNSIILEINATSGYRRAALKKIHELGYDPTNYKINFIDYESPFENE